MYASMCSCSAYLFLLVVRRAVFIYTYFVPEYAYNNIVPPEMMCFSFVCLQSTVLNNNYHYISLSDQKQ